MNKTYGEKCLFIRQKFQLSQGDLGSRLGVTYSTVHRWETSKNGPVPRFRAAIDELYEKATTGADRTESGRQSLHALRDAQYDVTIKDYQKMYGVTFTEHEKTMIRCIARLVGK